MAATERPRCRQRLAARRHGLSRLLLSSSFLYPGSDDLAKLRALGGVLHTSMLCFAGMAVIMVLANRMLDESTEATIAAALAPLVAVPMSLCWLFVEPQTDCGSTIARRLMPGPHLAVMIPFIVWYLLYSPVSPPPTSFVLYPVTIGIKVCADQMLFAFRGFPISTRLGILAVQGILHIVRPMFGIGWQEHVLILGGGLIGLVCGAAVRIDTSVMYQLVELAKFNRHADSKLNHVIKGQCGGAAALLSTLIESQEGDGESTKSSEADAKETLHHIRAMLLYAIEWCHKREVFLQLEEHSYMTTQSEIHLQSELQRMLGPHVDVNAVGSIRVDETILRLVVQEVATNAAKYSPPGHRFRVEAKLKEDPVSSLETLHLSISNQNRTGIQPLSASECARVFEKGFRKDTLRACSGNATHSNGLGLSSVKLAVSSIGGNVCMTADEHTTTVHFEIPASRCVDADVVPPESANSVKGGNELIKFVSEPRLQGGKADSTEVHHSQIEGSPPSINTPNTDSLRPSSTPPVPEICDSSTAPCKQASTEPLPLRPPVCIGIDDSPHLRRMQTSLFDRILKADAIRSGSVGSCADDVGAFIDMVLGRCTLSMEPANLLQADIAVLDEHIEFELEDNMVCIRGSDLAIELRAQGFTGVVCILSASCKETLHELATLPGVDYAFDKCASIQSVGAQLRAAYAAKERHANTRTASCRTLLESLSRQQACARELAMLPRQQRGVFPHDPC